MKSLEHAAVGGVVGVAAAILLRPPVSLPVLVVTAVVLSVFVDLDHFVLARAERGDWATLELAVTNPRVGLFEQERLFEEFDDEFDLKRLFTHHLLGGVAVAGVALAGSVSLAAFVAVVLYAHVVCDYLRDLGLA
ncbi:MULTISPECIES: metal-dependent hydrolase [Haloferax]|uniref:Membrane-bound metal-dependent hydrolase n=1 Tax=Haloferax marinum TaxID=2666143 RepID=A0A6A8G692_9EURY|nr:MULTISPECIES: metal-dependent hydrolase [Haloferax]KAB1196773.1 hypothetical protein Hfx1150_04250 [Haloferax sp. CBA1150]MRW95783.1 hypothetical protein [Haloferax marinum]